MPEAIPLEEILKSAEDFIRVFNTRKKSEAFNFYKSLPEEVKIYISKNKPYSLYLRASQLQI